MFISPFMAIASEYIQIIVAAIYAVTLFYTIVTFQRSKRLDQIASLGDVMNELRDVEREMAKIPAGSQFDDVRNSWSFRMFNSLEWLSFMINERIITDKKLMEYIKPMIISYYENTFLKSGSGKEKDSSQYQQFKKLYQTVKKQVQTNKGQGFSMRDGVQFNMNKTVIWENKESSDYSIEYFDLISERGAHILRPELA